MFEFKLFMVDIVQCYFALRQKDHYEVKWFIPLVELSLEDKLLSPGRLTNDLFGIAASGWIGTTN